MLHVSYRPSCLCFQVIRLVRLVDETIKIYIDKASVHTVVLMLPCSNPYYSCLQKDQTVSSVILNGGTCIAHMHSGH